MAYDGIDLKNIVQLCEDNVRHLDTQARKWRQVEDGTFDYASLIPDELYSGGTETPLIERRKGLRADVEIVQSLVGWPARITVDFPKAGPEATRKEDEMEAYFAYSSHMCDPRGELKFNLHNYQVLWPYTGIWQSVVPYTPPKKRRGESDKDYEYRIKAYDKKYWRYAWDVPIPSHVSFISRKGTATTACISEELPVLDFMELYAEREHEDGYDGNPLNLYIDQYDWLRATDGTAPSRDNSNEWFQGNKKIKRTLVCNGSEIYHCIDFPGSKGREFKKHIEVPNTFGRCSFSLVYGTYRPGGEVEYAPLIAEIAEAYHNVTLNQSLYKTMLANDKWLTALPESVASDISRQISGMELDDPSMVKLLDQYQVKVLPGHSNPVMGQPTNASNLPEKWWDSIRMAEDQLAQVRAPILALRPDEVTQRNAPATSVLAAQQEGTRPWRRATTSWNTAVSECFLGQAHDMVYGLNPHVGNVDEKATDNHRDYMGKPSSDAVQFLAGDYSGKSNYQPASRIEKGSSHKLTPEAFKELLDDGSVKVEPIEETDASRAANVSLVKDLLNNVPPLATPQDVWEAEGETDITGKTKKLNAYIMAQHLFPKQENMIWVQWLEKVAAREGRSVPEMAALVGAMPPMAGNGDNTPNSKPMMNTQSMTPPPGPTPPAQGAV